MQENPQTETVRLVNSKDGIFTAIRLLSPCKGQSEQATRREDHPGWLEARVEGELSKSENIVVEMGGGVCMLVGNGAQAALAGELLRAMGLGRGC